MPAEPVFLSDFRVILPKYFLNQALVIRWLASAHVEAEGSLERGSERTARIEKMVKMISRFGCDPTRIRTRYSALEDFTHEDWDEMRIFRLRRFPAGAPASERSAFFDEVVQGVFREFYVEIDHSPDRLIHVTCTGYVSPSGAQRLVAEKGWGDRVAVTHAYHMGCYASLPAIRIAHGYLRSDEAASRVDLVHTELCALHMDPSRKTPEQLVVQSLFADGFIKYSASRAPEPTHASGLEMIASREEILAGTEGAMTWMASDSGMQMTLSREVPEIVSKVLPAFLERLFSDARLNYDPMIAESIFAIHPGGPRIVDLISGLLGLAPGQCAATRKVLLDRGNMSSATLPHIWKDLVEDPNVPSGTRIVSLAFGPGLTVSGAVFKKWVAS